MGANLRDEFILFPFFSFQKKIDRFDFFRFIVFAMYLDIIYVSAKYINLEKSKRPIFWNGESKFN